MADDEERETLWKILIEEQNLLHIAEDAQTEYLRLIDDSSHQVDERWTIECHIKLLRLKRRPLCYALRKRKFDFIQMIFKHCVSLDQLKVALRYTDDEMNFVQLLAQTLLKLSNRGVDLSTKRFPQLMKENVAQLLSQIIDLAEKNSSLLFELFATRHESAVFQLVKSPTTYVLFQRLLEKLPNKMPLLLSEMVCHCGENHQILDVKCHQWYNLLMSAIEQRNIEAVRLIIGYLNQMNAKPLTNIRTWIILGRQRATVKKPVRSNSLLIAAQNKLWSVFNRLLELLPWTESGPESERVKALLETNSKNRSALQELVMLPSELKEILKVKHIIVDLQYALAHDDCCMYRFMELKMPLGSVEVFEEYSLFSNRYLIPKIVDETDTSRPEVLILFNEGEGNKFRRKIRSEAEKIARAFRGLGWEKNVTLIDLRKTKGIRNIVTNRIKDVRLLCSLFILCISSHGNAAAVQDANNELVNISDLLSEMRNLSPFIPKVLILNRCRNMKSPQMERVSENEKLPQTESMPGNEESPQMESIPGNEESPQMDSTSGNEESLQMESTPGNEESPQMESTSGNEESPQMESTPGNEESPQTESMLGNDDSLQMEILSRLADNMLILEATLPGTKAEDGFYLNELAVEIAGGNETLQEMHIRAKSKAMHLGSEEIIQQTPHQESTAKKIYVLKRWVECPQCEQGEEPFDYTRHVICYKCMTFYHLRCAELKESDRETLEKPGVKWICFDCRGP